MKNTLIVLLIIIILGVLGYVWYQSQQPSGPGEMQNDMAQDTEEAEEEAGDSNTADETKGDEVSIGVEVDVEVTAGAVKEFTVTGSNFAFAPKSLTVKKGDTVKVRFVNSDGLHDFVIDEFKVATAKISGGKEETVTFVADKAGTFEYYCSIGSHRQMGMMGTLIVTE